MKFRMAQASYIDNKFYVEDAILDLNSEDHKAHTHIPGPHWEPQDDDARALSKKHGIEYTGFVPDSIDKMAKELDEALERQKNAGNPDKIAVAMVAALMEAGVIAKAGKKAPAPAEI